MPRGPLGNREKNRDALAEAVSRHGNVVRAAREIGISSGYARNLWSGIVRALGWQAR